MLISFVVYGEPKAKARPRVFSRGGKHMVFSPSAQHERDFLSQAIQHKPSKPLTSSLSVDLRFYLPIPLSKSKKWQERAKAGQEYPTKKPDIDNLIKIIDALNTIFWADDKQIVQITACKYYSDKPRTEVTIEEIQ